MDAQGDNGLTQSVIVDTGGMSRGGLPSLSTVFGAMNLHRARHSLHLLPPPGFHVCNLCAARLRLIWLADPVIGRGPDEEDVSGCEGSYGVGSNGIQTICKDPTVMALTTICLVYRINHVTK